MRFAACVNAIKAMFSYTARGWQEKAVPDEKTAPLLPEQRRDSTVNVTSREVLETPPAASPLSTAISPLPTAARAASPAAHCVEAAMPPLSLEQAAVTQLPAPTPVDTNSQAYIRQKVAAVVDAYNNPATRKPPRDFSRMPVSGR